MPKRIEIDDQLLARVQCQCPTYLTATGFINLLIDQALDMSCTLGKPSRAQQALAAEGGEGFTSSSSSTKEENFERLSPKSKRGVQGGKRDPYRARVISVELVPDDLLDCQQLLPEFWSVKKGTRSESVWNRVCGKLRGWTPEQRREALERAIAGGWGDVFEPGPQHSARAVTGGGRKPLDQLASEMDAMPSLW